MLLLSIRLIFLIFTFCTSEPIYAAIAAAIHMYNEELHDEEPTVITIQKTERSWTPWNAKYISMNKYFNNR